MALSMVECVFRPSRRVGQRRIFSRLFSGRYTTAPGERRVTVALHTPDEQVARKRLRDIVVEKQREAEGLISPKSVREAASMPLLELLANYAHDLQGRELTRTYVHDTLTRLERIAAEAGWHRLADIRPDSFVLWRSTLKGSAKTRKEYQTSVNAFLNWLVRVDRLVANPLAKIAHRHARKAGAAVSCIHRGRVAPPVCRRQS